MARCLRNCWLGLGAALFLTGCSAFVSDRPVYKTTWSLAHPVSLEATRVDLLIHETECSGGASPEGRTLDPTVVYTAASITITIQLRPTVAVGCPFSPDSQLTVNLSEPVGNRELIDGGQQSYEPGATSTPKANR